MPLAFRHRLSVCAMSRGFSLLEAIVASAILLLTSAAVTGVITTTLRAQSVEGTQAQLEQRVQAELARLSALPYVLPAAAPGVEGYDPAATQSLLQAVFPHSDLALNVARAFFTPASAEKPCSFTTISEQAWGTMHVVCGFVSMRDGTWAPSPESGVEGWAVWRRATAPASAVLVTIQASAAGEPPHLAETSIVLDALRPLRAEPVP